MASYRIVNPLNNLVWAAHRNSFVSLMSGDYKTYASKAIAERAIRRTNSLRFRSELIVEKETA